MPRPPILALLLRAIVWTPVGFFLMILWLGTIAGAAVLPVLSIFHLYVGEYRAGLIQLLVAVPCYFIGRYLTRRFWSPPESLL